jgi:hypothetical protein
MGGKHSQTSSVETFSHFLCAPNGISRLIWTANFILLTRKCKKLISKVQSTDCNKQHEQMTMTGKVRFGG